ncbi:MAG: PD40 domain-containing protein [Bacteroidales bacterium]|nr:PD40 domain-containing protein [Bacteroidales bacterium]
MTCRIFRLAVIIAAVCPLLVSGGCSSLEAAQKAYALGEYSKAAGLYESVQKDEQNKVRRAEECFILGECYRHLGQNVKAASAYQKAIRYKHNDDIVYLRLGDVLRSIGKFDEAEQNYDEYKKRRKTDLRTIASEESLRLSRDNWAVLSAKNGAQDSGYTIEKVKEFASKGSDFSPSFVGDAYDVVYFTSMRQLKRRGKPSKITGQAKSGLFMSKIDAKGKWTTPEPLEEPFGVPHVDDGVAYVSPDGRSMLFTRCPMDDQQGSAVHSYESKREGGRWSEPVRIVPGGDSTMMVAHPALSPDGMTLYFVSDKEEGSIGGKDIWLSKKNGDDTWGPAENLGPMVNTAGDEMFPYVRIDGSLYFSSDGHKGYGGLDIYRATIGEDGRYVVVNMGVPINSQGDDFGIAFMGMAEEGLLSSNRGNPKGIDDIYSFYLPPVILTIEGTVGKKVASQQTASKGKTTKGGGKSSSKSSPKQQNAVVKIEPVKDSFVRIVGSDGTNVKMNTTEAGVISFVAERDVRYIILAGAPGYANQRTEISTEGLNKTQTLKFVSALEKIN